MAALTDVEGVRAAWRALSGGGDGDGWRTILVSTSISYMLLAGRHLPNGEEALLIGFRTIREIPCAALPQGHGFEVSWLPSGPAGVGRSCLALTRRKEASLELFVMMAEDLISLLDDKAFDTEGSLLKRFLARIQAWQDFMERKGWGTLSPEAEVGLFGELVVLDQLLDAGVPARLAVDVWQGPMDGLQDFIFGSGAIEVKTTLSATAFPASVGSLDQLDETRCHPLFVFGVRLAADASGKTLPSMADAIRDRLRDESAALDILETRLVLAGLPNPAAERHVRRLTHVSTTIFHVSGRFPRLTPSNVNPGIRRARYEIDLSLMEGGRVELTYALDQLGVK